MKAHFQKITKMKEPNWKTDLRTNFLLVLIAIALITIAVRPYLAPQPGAGAIRGSLSFLPRTWHEDAARPGRKPPGLWQGDRGYREPGKVWGFPTFTPDTYPVNGADSKPQTFHPFVLGKFAFEDTDK